MGTTKACVECSQDIVAAARRCHHCGALQSRLRFVEPFSALLSVGAAVVSTLAAGAHWASALLPAKGDHVELSLVAVDASTRTVTVLASNSGDKAGAIASAWISVPSDSVRDAGSPRIDLALPARRLIQAGEMMEIVLTSSDPLPSTTSVAAAKSKFKLGVELYKSTRARDTREFIFEGHY